MQVTTCAQCGATFEGRHKRAKYCSKPCVYKAERDRQAATGYQARYRSQPDIAAKRKAYGAPRAREYRQEAKVLATCTVCEGTWLADGKARTRPVKYCSRQCQAIDLHGGPRTPVPAKHPIRSTPVPETHPARQSTCARCKQSYVIQGMGQLYCSDLCAQRARVSRRDARKRGQWIEDVSPIAVYVRDEWACKLCGDPLDRGAVVPHPLAPTVDHVIPLARGGEHSMVNVQAAHFLCNSRKGDRLELAVS